MDLDPVFRALADPSRRQLLDRLRAQDGQRLTELCRGLDMTRQAVSRHLAVLEAAALVTTVRRGREKLHYLNPVPISEIADRWIGRYHQGRLDALADLRAAMESTPMEKPAFVYTTYIRTTPERLWQALTDHAFVQRYWGGGPRSDWKVGSPVSWQMALGEPYVDLDQVVLESDPPRRLSYSWHNYQPEHRRMFGWSEEQFAELVQEPRSRVTFELEPAASTVKLTVIHDGFERETEMLKALSGGWPQILSTLKTLLETGEAPSPEHRPDGERAPRARAGPTA
ncbi:MAG TPA: metalloregulator ArsR/SmtB family transcription factor [Candidatus Dormibacteraeota bacterium]|nr:metalloregulator ArsR/SmtB family transcription factor [Candidatus Dormibacteraeota bacterium]